MPLRIILLPFLIFLLSCNNDKPTATDTPPEETKALNILWLVAEDLGMYLPDFGDPTVETPNLSRLAAEGVCYDNFFTPAPVCSPARSAIATGMYPTRIGSTHMRTGPWYAFDISPEILKRFSQFMPEGVAPYEAMPPVGTRMMSEYLREGGYYCTNNAKQDYQFRRTLSSWDQCDNKAHFKNRKPGQAFFAIFNFGVTHESQIWARAKDSLWVDENLEVNVPPYLPDTEIGRRDVRRMYSNIKEMDFQVGKILDDLEAEGELENTIIFWYSDHGGPLPRQKRLLYDSGVKVPLIIRFPNKVNAGTRNDELLSFIDLAPSVLSLANIEPPKIMDGKAFLGPYQSQEKAKYIFAAGDRFDETYDTNRAARDKRFKYIRYYQTEKPMFLHVNYRDQMPIMQELYRLKDAGRLTEAQSLWFRENKPKEELFDTQADPHEINNLADDPSYADKLAELRKACEDWVKSTGDMGMIPEKQYLASIWPDGVQPQTEFPQIESENGKLILKSGTKGASIAYKKIPEGGSEPTSWSVYTGAIQCSAKDTLKIIADRLGYLPSEELIFINE